VWASYRHYGNRNLSKICLRSLNPDTCQAGILSWGGGQQQTAPRHSQNTYSVHAFKRSAIKRRIANKRSATSATQLLFPIQIVMFKRRIAVSGAWNWKPRHSAWLARPVYRSLKETSTGHGSPFCSLTSCYNSWLWGWGGTGGQHRQFPAGCVARRGPYGWRAAPSVTGLASAAS